MQDTNVIEQLLDIYAHSKHDVVNQNATYHQLFKQYGKRFWFEEAKDRIETVKSWIEDKVLIQESTKNQVVESLRLLRKRKASGDEIRYEYASKLIKKIFTHQWKSEQIQFFEDACCIIENWRKDYFLSFTDRSKTKPNRIDMLHLNHQYFIRDILGIRDKREWSKRTKENKNLLAEAIDTILKDKLNGYYYHLHVENHNNVEEKLEKECKECFAFVQLVQNILFEKSENKNYCHWEYTLAQQENKRRLYIIAEKSYNDLKDIEDVDEQYDQWLKEIKSRDNVQLKYTERYNPTLICEIKDKITDKIARKIEYERKQLFENVPD